MQVCYITSGFVWVIENLETHRIQEFRFQACKVMEFKCWSWKVMENSTLTDFFKCMQAGT